MPVISTALATIAVGLGATATTAATVGAMGAAAIYGAGAAKIASNNSGSKNKAENAARDQMQNQDRLEGERVARQLQQESEEAAIGTRDSSRNRQKALAAGAMGRRDTILTSPLGAVPDLQSQKGKTILGA